ncbi:hypothetical protein H4I96_06889 [Botrytis cinerea]
MDPVEQVLLQRVRERHSSKSTFGSLITISTGSILLQNFIGTHYGSEIFITAIFQPKNNFDSVCYHL